MISLKRIELSNIYKLVDGVFLNKIENTEVRKLVIKLVLEGKRNEEHMSSDLEDIRKKFFSEFKNEDLDDFQKALNEITLLTKSKNFLSANLKDKETSEKYPEITSAYKSFSDALTDLQNEIVEINVDKVEMDNFVEAMLGQNVNISSKELDIFEPIIKNDSEN